MEAKTKTTKAIPETVRIVVSLRVQRFRKLYENGIAIDTPVTFKASKRAGKCTAKTLQRHLYGREAHGILTLS
ncbi:MAG: hypothetical protein MUP27_00930 [Desulfobacterales bacterium]|jgi:hypothetical protein|nr:hypothetical protein [Desulfobacterales bacterium]